MSGAMENAPPDKKMITELRAARWKEFPNGNWRSLDGALYLNLQSAWRALQAGLK